MADCFVVAKDKCASFAREKCLVPFRDAKIRVAKGVLSSKGVGKLIGWGSVPVSGRNMWLMNQMGLISGDLGKKCFYQRILSRFINRYQPIYGEVEKRYIHDPLLPQVDEYPLYCMATPTISGNCSYHLF
ncbi:uncharacterized protein LOC108330017 isoform X2 [Vigna angularis]|uniref:uncharacterized protein LOC108330017 isoform X2 n=2 Tax=Phaseolus angularis TaxID=3914 RepID=UPI00080A0B67|nr:uncharacterized protein LOC108330017 isoform X2 [Vigna angularis]